MYRPVKSPKNGETTQNNKAFGIWHDILGGIRTILNPYSIESLWPLLGGILLLTPLSLVLLFSKGQGGNPILLLLIIYFSLLSLTGFFVKHHIYSPGKGSTTHYYFNGRQMFILFPVLAAINGIALTHLLSTGQSIISSIYLCYILFHTVHQIYRLIDYYLSKEINEIKFTTHKYVPPAWQLELGEFIANRDSPMIFLGSYLIFGETHNFYEWNKNKKFVDVYYKLKGNDFLDLLNTHKISHIILTPFSCFNTDTFDVFGKVKHQPLKKFLVPVSTSSANLVIYEVDPKFYY